MRSFHIILLVLFISVASAQQKKDDAPTTEKQPLGDEQVEAIVAKVMQSNLKGKSADDIKAMIKAEIKSEQTKSKASIYHHVHKSVEDAEDVAVEEYVAGDAIKLGQQKGIFQMKHQINKEFADEEEAAAARMVKPVDPETAELQAKYEKMLKEILKENADENKPKPSQLELIAEVEKRMKAKQKNHPVKTSDRMIVYLEEILRKLNGGTLKDADKFDMKGFVSSVFGRYRNKHNQEKERKRRILALQEHLVRDNRNFEHQPNFYDEFYEPNERGYDASFNMRQLAPHRNADEEPVLMTSVLPHPQRLKMSENDRKKYLGYEHHSDHDHLPLNMPAVAPDTSTTDLLSALNIDASQLKNSADDTGIINSLKSTFKSIF